MEKNKDCQIVEDLLIGYKDKTLNPESQKLVENHIKTCSNCKDFLKDIQDENNVDIKEETEFDHLKKLNKKMKNKNKIVAILLIIILLNIAIFINYLSTANTLQIYLADDVTTEELEDIKNSIKKIDEDAEITYVSKDDELNKMKENLGENANLLDNYDLENNIFPASYIVKSDFSKLKNIENAIINKDGVKSIRSNLTLNPYETIISKIIE